MPSWAPICISTTKALIPQHLTGYPWPLFRLWFSPPTSALCQFRGWLWSKSYRRRWVWAIFKRKPINSSRFQVRQFGVTVCTISLYLCAFFVLKFFPPLSYSLGLHGCMWIFSVCCTLGIFFIIFVLKETKGSSLDDDISHKSSQNVSSKWWITAEVFYFFLLSFFCISLQRIWFMFVDATTESQ